MDAPQPTGNRPPLNPVEFMVLLLLAEGEKHGYLLVKEMEERTSGRISVLPGNFYVVLRRLQRDRLIEESDRRPAEKHRGRPRRYYRITRRGRDVAAAEAEHLKELVADAARVDLLGDAS